MAEEQAVFNAKMIDNLKKLQAATEKLAAIVEEMKRPSGEVRTGGQPRSMGTTLCSVCQQRGHVASGCRHGATLSCYRCKQEEHISRGCRQPQLNGHGPH